MHPIGQRFGNYRAVSLLGEGGMGAVYLAEHPDIGRKVAIKILREEFGRDSQLLQRFLNEARAANAICHPNIIKIEDSGTTEGGLSYLVMELLEGESLASRIRRVGRLPLRDALEFGYQIASAVGAAHRKGIIHRDLKPDNIFVIPDPHEAGREQIKVLDFGIAKLISPGPGESVKTRTGTMMGTPVYMSPEQCLGTREVDARSDIYALGLIMFEMLCGKPPFFSEGFGELVNMHLNTPPPVPRSLVRDLPPLVEAVVLRALAKKPLERFPSMAELQAALKNAVGSAFILRGSSSPDLVRETLPATSAVGGPAVRPSTTFSSHAGDFTASNEVPRSRGRPLLVVGLLAVVAAVTAGVFFARKGPAQALPPPPTPTPPPVAVAPKPKVEPPPPPPTVAKISLQLDTHPSGAHVIRVADGQLLGATPYRQQLEPSAESLELRLEHEGYRTARVTARLDRDFAQTVKLEPRRPSEPGGKKPKSPKPRDEEPAKL